MDMELFNLKVDYFAYVKKRKAFYPVIQLNFETGEAIIMSQKSSLRFVVNKDEFVLLRNTHLEFPEEFFENSKKGIQSFTEDNYFYLKEGDIVETDKKTEFGDDNFIITYKDNCFYGIPIVFVKTETCEGSKSCPEHLVDLDYLCYLGIKRIYNCNIRCGIYLICPPKFLGGN